MHLLLTYVDGRWKSETAKDGYVKDSLSSRLQVSRHIGL